MVLSEHGLLSQNGAVKYLSLLKKVVNRAVANKIALIHLHHRVGGKRYLLIS